MRIRLDPRWTEYLLNLPESGMGYQRVDVELADGRVIENVIVLNAELIEMPEDVAKSPIAGITLHAA